MNLVHKKKLNANETKRDILIHFLLGRNSIVQKCNNSIEGGGVTARDNPVVMVVSFRGLNNGKV